MIMYGVVVCSRCKRAKGVDLKQKTTTCSCGFEIPVSRTRVRAQAATAHELAALVGQVNAELRGASAQEIIRAAVREFASGIGIITSLSIFGTRLASQ